MSGWTSLALVLAIVAALAALWTHMQRRRRARGASLGPFLRHFDTLQIPDHLTLAIYHHLERWMEDSQGSVAIGPRDHLARYGIGTEDVDDALELLLAACGRRTARDPARPPITTVEDLVRYVASRPPMGGSGKSPFPGSASH